MRSLLRELRGRALLRGAHIFERAHLRAVRRGGALARGDEVVAPRLVHAHTRRALQLVRMPRRLDSLRRAGHGGQVRRSAATDLRLRRDGLRALRGQHVLHPARPHAERRRAPRAHRRGLREESFLRHDWQRRGRRNFRRALIFPDFPQGADEGLAAHARR